MLQKIQQINHNVCCSTCGERALLVKGSSLYVKESPELYDYMQSHYYWCVGCDAYVGTHKKPENGNWIPLGTLADEPTRKARYKAHLAFDRLWQKYNDMSKRRQARTAWYSKLASHLGIPKEECHIGLFNVEQCMKTVTFANIMRIQNVEIEWNDLFQ